MKEPVLLKCKWGKPLQGNKLEALVEVGGILFISF
jgi:hypothetical protein